ncbi:MAG: tetratricopeptide repeat protein [Bacteroidia bacterium]|nr:tetratricopeptide repeat protein [Bacteroidia bacterium]
MKTQLPLFISLFIFVISGFSQSSPYVDYIQKGKNFIDNKNVDSALYYFNKAYSLDSKRVEAIYEMGYLLGEVCLYTGNKDTCLQSVELLDKLDKFRLDESFMYSLRATVKMEIEDMDGAIRDYKTAIRMGSKIAEDYSQIAKIYMFALADFDSALNYINQAIALEPNEPIYYTNRAIIYRNIVNYQSALAEHDKAISLAPESSDFLVEKAITYFEARNFKEAKNYFEKALAIEPNSPAILHDLAFMEYGQGQLQNAMRHINQSIKLDSQDAESYVLRGLIKIEMEENGCEDFKRAMEMGSKNAQVEYEFNCDD